MPTNRGNKFEHPPPADFLKAAATLLIIFVMMDIPSVSFVFSVVFSVVILPVLYTVGLLLKV